MDACAHHSVRCERTSKYKLPFVPLTNSNAARHARSHQMGTLLTLVPHVQFLRPLQSKNGQFCWP